MASNLIALANYDNVNRAWERMLRSQGFREHILGDDYSLAEVLNQSATQPLTAASYGAVGDGLTDDTQVLQQALSDLGAAGGGILALTPGATYIVSRAGTKTTGAGSTVRYCLYMPPGVIIDGRGATLRLASDQNAALLVNEHLNLTTDSGIGIVDLRIDGNASGQSLAGDVNAEQACVFFWGAKVNVQGLTVVDAFQYSGRFLACWESEFHELSSVNSRGSGWSLGIAATTQHLTDSHIGSVRSQGSQGLTGLAIGNPFILTGIRVQVEAVFSDADAFGAKVQDTSTDIQIGQVLVNGTAADHGFKIEVGPARVQVAQVACRGCWGAGLYLQACTDTHVGQYLGMGNGASGLYPDVWVAGTGTRIQRLFSQGSKTDSAVAIRPDCVDADIGEVTVVDVDTGASGVGSVTASGGQARIGTVVARDTRGGGAQMASALKVTASAAQIYVGCIRASGLTVSAIQLLGGATVQTPQGLDVRWFGAVGDGITDDTAAIQAALDAAAAMGAGTVYLPRGQYLTSATLLVPELVKLRGDGYSVMGPNDFGSVGWGDGSVLGSVLRCAGAGLATVAGPCRTLDIEGLAIYGSGSGSHKGLDFSASNYVVNSRFSNLMVANFATGIDASGAIDDDWRAIKVWGCTTGLAFPADHTTQKFYGLGLDSCATGIRVEMGSYLKVFGGVFQNNGTAVRVAPSTGGGTTGLLLDDVWFENNVLELDLDTTTGPIIHTALRDCRCSDVVAINPTVAASLDRLIFDNCQMNGVTFHVKDGMINVDLRTTKFAAIDMSGVTNTAMVGFQQAGNYVTTQTQANPISKAYAAQVTPDCLVDGNVVFVVLTGGCQFQVPVNAPPGSRLTFVVKQDAGGGHAVTWAPGYVCSWSDTGNTGLKFSSISFLNLGANVWVQTSAQTPYAS